MSVAWRDHIESDPRVLRGRLRIKGTRIPVSLILGYLAARYTPEQISAEFPDINEDQIAACLDYAQSVTDEVHCRNIVNLANTITRKFRDAGALRCERFRIGIAQKSLNLYLKYLWCLGDTPTPPHCPLDRRIVDKLNPKVKDRRDWDWTKIDDIEKYKKLIEKCRQVAGDTYLAEWELREWSF